MPKRERWQGQRETPAGANPLRGATLSPGRRHGSLAADVEAGEPAVLSPVRTLGGAVGRGADPRESGAPLPKT